MAHTVGRIVIGVGLGLSFVWTFIPLGQGVGSLWELASRFDVLASFVMLGGISSAVVAFFVTTAEWLDRTASVIAGGAAAILVYFAVEAQWDEPLRVLFACFIAAALVAGVVLLSLSPAGEQRFAALLAGARSRATAPRAQASARDSAGGGVTVAAGWYPDPSGQHSTRFWDGADWTEEVR